MRSLTPTHRVAGKTTFFVANQAKIEEMPAEKQAALESECKSVEEENKQRTVQVKVLSAGMPGPLLHPPCRD
jgi:TRAP-type C4-dicarboxylate transport system substrate-binding protein